MGKKQTTGSDPFAEFGGTAIEQEADPFTEFGGSAIEQQPPFPQAPSPSLPAALAGRGGAASAMVPRPSMQQGTPAAGAGAPSGQASQQAPVPESAPAWTTDKGVLIRNYWSGAQRIAAIDEEFASNEISQEDDALARRTKEAARAALINEREILSKAVRPAESVFKKSLDEAVARAAKEDDGLGYLKQDLGDGKLRPSPHNVMRRAKELAAASGMQDDDAFVKLLAQRLYSHVEVGIIAKDAEKVFEEQSGEWIKRKSDERKASVMSRVEEERAKAELYQSEAASRISAQAKSEGDAINAAFREESKAWADAFNAQASVAAQQRMDRVLAELQHQVNSGAVSVERANAMLKAEGEKIDAETTADFNKQAAALAAKAQQALNAVNTKYNRMYAEEAKRVVEGANKRISAAVDAAKAAGISADEEKEFKQRWEAAWNKAASNRGLVKEDEAEAKRKAFRAMAEMEFGPTIGPALGDMVNSIHSIVGATTASMGNAIKSFANSYEQSPDWMRMDSGTELTPAQAWYAIGQNIENQFETKPVEAKEFKQYLDPIDGPILLGQFIGGTLPSIVAGGTAAAMTGGAGTPAVIPLLTSAIASHQVETMQISGDAYGRMLEKTGDPSKARKAWEDSYKAQVMLAPAYAFEGLPFVGKALRGVPTRAGRVATGAAAELIQETIQETFQQIADKNIMEGRDPYENVGAMFDEMVEKGEMKSLMVAIAPAALMGGAPQVVSQSRKSALEEGAKAYIAKTKAAEYASSAPDQWINSMVAANGKDFAGAVIGSMYGAGQITQQQAEDLMMKRDRVLAYRDEASRLNLSDSDTRAYVALSSQMQAIQQEAAAMPDGAGKKAVESRAQEIGRSIDDFVNKGKRQWVEVGFGDGKSIIMDRADAMKALSDPSFIAMAAQQGGSLSIAFNGDGMEKIAGEFQGKVMNVEDVIERARQRSEEERARINDPEAIARQRERTRRLQMEESEELGGSYGIFGEMEDAARKPAQPLISDEVDPEVRDRVIRARQELGVSFDPMNDLPESVVIAFERAEDDKPVSPFALDAASDWLYKKYKQVVAMRDDPERELTIDQIDGLMEQLGSDIELLETYKQKQREQAEGITGAQAQPQGQVDAGADTQAAQEGGQGQQGQVIAQTKGVVTPTPQENGTVPVGQEEEVPVQPEAGSGQEVPGAQQEVEPAAAQERPQDPIGGLAPEAIAELDDVLGVAETPPAVSPEGPVRPEGPTPQAMRVKGPAAPRKMIYVKNVQKALAQEVPGLKVTVHQDPQQYRAAIEAYNKANNTTADPSASVAIYLPGTDEIHLSPGADGQSLAHEAAHPIVSALIANKPELFNRLYDEIAADPALKNIMDFGKLYADTNETVIKAETIVRFMDAVASGEIKVSTDPKSAWQRFKAWLSEILAKMGLGPKDIDLSNPANVREFASMFSRAISEGIEIRKIRGDKGTADAGPMMQRRSPSEVAATFSKHGLSPDQAMEYMKQRGVSDDFAQQVVAEMQPKEEAETTAAPAEEERVKKTLVTKRAYEGDFRSEVKAEIEKVGLYRDTETHEQAKAKANELIQRIGLDAALDAVRAGDIRGGAAAYVWNAAMENTDEQIMKADSQEELARLYSEQAQLLEEAGIQQLESGRFGSAWASIYDGSGLGYNAAAQSKKWKDSFGKEPSDEMKEEWRKRDEEIAELKKKILEAEKRAEEAEANAAVNAIKQSINRKGGVRKTHTQRAKEVADQFRKLKTKPIQFKDADGNPIDVTRMGFDWNELVEVGARAIEKAGQGADMVAAAMKAISEKLNEYEWYRNLSQRDRDAVDEQIREQYMAQSDDGMETGSMTIPKSLVRDIVASGVSDIDTLVAKVKEAVADTYPNATDREIRDAITDYGRVLNMSKDEISAEVRRLRALGRMISAIEDVSAGKRPLRSGLQRDRMDAELRAKSKELRQLMKNLPVDQETMDRELKTALDAAKTRVRNRIEDLQREIDTRQRTPRNTKAVEPDQELTDLIAERDALQERHDQVFGSSSMTAEERLSAAINSAKRSADEIERRIANMELEPKKREPVKETPELARERARLAAARAELNSLREQAGIIEAKRLDAAKKAARKRIDDLQRRLRDGDFSKKQIKRVDEDAELTKLRGERLRLQDQYDKEFEKERIRQRSTREKAMDAAWELYGLTRALQATAEFSFVLIQGGKLTISNLWHKPSAVAYAFKNALSGAARESRTEEWISNIRAQEWYPLAKKSGLAITEPSAKLTAREEVFFSGWSEFIWSAIGSPLRLVSKKLFDKWNQYNVFRIIERAAVMYLDTLRVERWLDAMEALDMRKAEGKEVSEKDYKDAANMINTLTGRASLGPAERMAPVLSKVFFSPRLWASSVKTATPYALYHFGKMSPTARNMALADMGRYIGTTMAFVALAGINLDDDDDEKTYVETDPRSADFGKIRMGNRRIDPWGGMAQQVVWTSRIVADILGMQSYKRTSGEIMRLGEKNAPTGLDITVQMATNKLAPSASLIAERMTTKLNRRGDRVTKYGEEYDPVSSIAERLYPIYAGTVIDLMKNDPGALEGFLVAYAFFGGGVQEYEDKKKKKSKND